MKANLKSALVLGLVLLLGLCGCFAFAGAEEPEAVETLLEIIPLEPGMTGSEVENLNARLTVLGYLTGELSDEYGEATEDAMRAFQTVAGIEATGVADVATQQALLAEDAPVNPDNPPEGEMVWISKTGEKYHSNWNCSGMQGPSCVSLEEAEAQGLTACSKCYPEQ